VGPNGQGKSTVLKLCAGELEGVSGAIFRNPRIRIARFSQHHVDQLNLDQTPVEFLQGLFPGKDSQFYRSHLGSYGVQGQMALQTIRTLSGGQKSRVVFAVMAMRQPHFLMLDEPTNHLDVETVDVLIQALNDYTGGVLLVSHDERLITACCNELWIVENSHVTPFQGDFDAYKKSLEFDV